jgi:hypothetical protein
MNCFSAVSLLSLLPGCIQSVLRLPHNPSSIWGGEEEGVEETERPPEPVASHTTTLYTCSDNATYSMMPPISKSPAALSGLRQENERAYIPDLASPHGNFQILQSFYWHERHGILKTFSFRYCQSVCHLYARQLPLERYHC